MQNLALTVNPSKMVKEEITYPRTFNFDLSKLTKDSLISASEFESYISSKLKINGRLDNFGDDVEITSKNDSLEIKTNVPIKKSYLVFLGKKFLHKKELRDWVKIARNEKGFSLEYYNEENEEAEE
ncbi:hypothetical protein EDEG_03443 [Edhazardia aedis USNM 41457]|uniref:Large ribosomal subunit protein eL22 n=1 Tax=Edhazardia aedis (strain USNM 41457) TaxID=1003232 RepID=J9D2T4_EDHAE|nr:hypothetical protein EDEG_03443 [Edhazardia aedis USNM 41457]|eukprot:EJW02111.1 hypothetical protein EDEG_03443 [Edhazardia aedis USNM 41457]